MYNSILQPSFPLSILTFSFLPSLTLLLLQNPCISSFFPLAFSPFYSLSYLSNHISSSFPFNLWIIHPSLSLCPSLSSLPYALPPPSFSPTPFPPSSFYHTPSLLPHSLLRPPLLLPRSPSSVHPSINPEALHNLRALVNHTSGHCTIL